MDGLLGAKGRRNEFLQRNLSSTGAARRELDCLRRRRVKLKTVRRKEKSAKEQGWRAVIYQSCAGIFVDTQRDLARVGRCPALPRCVLIVRGAIGQSQQAGRTIGRLASVRKIECARISQRTQVPDRRRREARSGRDWTGHGDVDMGEEERMGRVEDVDDKPTNGSAVRPGRG